MYEKFKTTSNFLKSLVALRKKMAEDERYEKKHGVLGVLLADKQGIVKDCIFCEPAHCCPAPATTGKELNKVIFEALKKGLTPIGVVVLNPDTGSVYGGYIGTGTDKAKDARYYTLYRLANLLKSFPAPTFLVVVDDENTPVLLTCSSQTLTEILKIGYSQLDKSSTNPDMVFKIIKGDLVKKDTDSDGSVMTISKTFAGLIGTLFKEALKQEKEVVVYDYNTTVP